MNYVVNNTSIKRFRDIQSDKHKELCMKFKHYINGHFFLLQDWNLLDYMHSQNEFNFSKASYY